VTIDPGDFVIDAPEPLSSRAANFLRTKARRQSFERGLAGERLEAEIRKVYGKSNDSFVRRLGQLQARYGGLTYHSGFFDSEVRFNPQCEPDSPDEELEILYAVETGGPIGASVTLRGDVEVGLDELGTVEFSSLDNLIESDALHGEADLLAHSRRVYLEGADMPEVLNRLVADAGLNLRQVDEASSINCRWFEGDSVVVFACSTWARLGLGMNPFISIWGDSEERVQQVEWLVI